MGNYYRIHAESLSSVFCGPSGCGEEETFQGTGWFRMEFDNNSIYLRWTCMLKAIETLNSSKW